MFVTFEKINKLYKMADTIWFLMQFSMKYKYIIRFFFLILFVLFLSAKHFYASLFPRARTSVNFTQILRPLGLNN